MDRQHEPQPPDIEHFDYGSFRFHLQRRNLTDQHKTA